MAGAGGISVATLRRGRESGPGNVDQPLGLRRVFRGSRPSTIGCERHVDLGYLHCARAGVIMVAIGVGSMKEFGLS